MSWGTMRCTVLAGMAKPTPLAGLLNSGSIAVSVGTPITRPLRSRSAPPLLPGLMAALVWMAPRICPPPLPSLTVRSRALTRPPVAVPTMPSGLPRATTLWPDLHGGGVAQRRRGQVLRGDLDDGEVVVGVGADDVRRQGRAIGKHHRIVGAVGHHVVVGHDVAVLAQDDA